MAFVPRTRNQIFEDMINYVRLNTGLTDYEIGSVIRTILEAAAIEDDEQYFQMVQLLDAFSINTATGYQLDKRAADYGLTRLQPSVSSGTIVIQNETLVQDELEFSVLAGAVSINLESSAEFPTSYPYTVRIGEGLVTVEDVTVSNNNTSTGVLTVSAVVNNHDIGERVALVTGAADVSIASGQQIQVPADGTTAAIRFVTTEIGTLVNGNYRSTPIQAKSVVVGAGNNIGSGTITEFTSSAPFSGASVINSSIFSGGRDLESDDEFRSRIRAQIQSLTKAIALALEQAVLGVTDPVTGQTIKTSNVFEDYDLDEVIVYIDDGTGFTPDKVQLATSAVNGNIVAPSATLPIDDASLFPSEGYIIVSPESASQIELLEYTSVNYGTNTLTLASSTTKNHDDGDEVALVDAISLDAESGQTFFRTSKYPITRNSDRLWIDSGSGYTLQDAEDDYILNRGIGRFQMTSGVAEGAKLVIAYTYYTGLIAYAQKIISGDSNDPVNFPGVAGAGLRAFVETPIIRRISMRISISAAAGFNEDDLAPLVQESVENYVSGLGIGTDVIIAEVIARAMEVDGVSDAIMVSPTSNISILENELPLPFDSNGTSLITVS